MIYIPANSGLCGILTGVPVKYQRGRSFAGSQSGGQFTAPGADHIGEVQAWNVDTGQKVWTHPYPTSPTWGSMLATAGGLVFTGGTNDRKIHAFDATTGKLLWEFVDHLRHRRTADDVCSIERQAVPRRAQRVGRRSARHEQRTQSPVPRSVPRSARGGRRLGFRASVAPFLSQKVQRRRLRSLLHDAQPCCRQLRSPSLRNRWPAKVAVSVQERQGDLRPDIRVDDHQQELPIGSEHARNFSQGALHAITVEMIGVDSRLEVTVGESGGHTSRARRSRSRI